MEDGKEAQTNGGVKEHDETLAGDEVGESDEGFVGETAEESREELEDSQKDSEDRVQARLEEAYGKRDELQNKYLRTVAELDNLRKRAARDREEISTRIKANLIGDLLPTMDAFRLGMEDARKREEAKGVVDGFAMVLTQFESVLGENGLSLIDPCGEPFDPNLHEAVARENSEDVDEGLVLSTVRVGYKLGERLLRPAAVVISEGVAESES
tara:strand:- start:161 stop:796 length:636 start_codon:yes stop_codon:yes gene_type:complete